jgi:hypothetical protein|tara:strand:- start:7 stop:411 length:405 start_codon:yes stop_codon:yes gene_type:complete
MYKIHLTYIRRISDNLFIPVEEKNSDYQQFKKDLNQYGFSIVEYEDIIEHIPFLDDTYSDKTIWQFFKGEDIIKNKYSDDEAAKVKALADLQEHKYVRAMEAKFPYESMKVAGPVIDATSQEIKDKYRHLPMRR